MLLIEATNIKKFYGERQILGFDRLQIHSGDKIGIVGRNGSGKTTLLNLLSGALQPDEGKIRCYASIAYIQQFSQEGAGEHLKALKEFKAVEAATRTKRSGGEQTRIKLANAIGEGSMILLADEPTANLDFEGIKLLSRKMSEHESFLLISHDRFLLEHLCSKIIEIENGSLTVYDGNYSAYQEQKLHKQMRAQAEYEQYARVKSDLEQAMVNRANRARTMKKAPSRMGNSEARLHKRSATEKQEKLHNSANSIKTRLENLAIKEKPRKAPQVFMNFALTNPPENKIVCSASAFSFGYGVRQLFCDAGFEIRNKQKTVIIGENGSGKTTLLNLVHQGCPGISTVPQAVIGYFYQGLKNLDLNKTALENVMDDSIQNETAARSILARLCIPGDGVHKKTSILSGGERMKVSFAKLMVSKANFLLLDEPTNFLDIESIEALQDLLTEYAGTVLYVSHDRTFVDNTADRLLIICENKLIPFEGNLSEYETYQKQRQQSDDAHIQLLKMRMAEVVSQISLPKADKETLERQYQEILKELQSYR